MARYNEITFVIVLYKSEDIILKCLSYLSDFNVIILDNSKDEILKKKILNNHQNIIKYIIPNKNLGYSAGNNLAAKFVKSQFIYFISPDIFLIESNLHFLIDEFKRNPKLGLITPLLINENYSPLNNRIIFPEKKKNKKKTKPSNHKIDWIWGASLLIKKDLFNKCNGFDERFFIYNSDVDLCKKINLLGYEILEYSNLKIIHLGAKSSKINFFENCKLKISHKFSFYQYLDKYSLLKKKKLIIDFIDFFQRMIVNLILFKFDKSLNNLLRIIAIIKFLFY